MKSGHVVLLVAGAAVAGAVAFKMTQPQPVPVPHSTSSLIAPAVKPAPLEIPSPKRVPELPAAAPPPVFVEPKAAPQNKFIRTNKPNPFQNPVPVAVKLPPPPAYVPPRPVVSVETSQPKPPRRQVTLHSGMTIAVSLSQKLPGCAKTGETFSGSLAEPLVADHLVIAERGARINGRCSGTAPVQLQLSRIVTSDGQLVSVSTEPRTSDSTGPISFRLISPVTVTEKELN